MICLVRPHLVGEVTNRPAVLAGRLGTCARLAGTCSRHKKGDKLILESLYIGGSMPVFTDSALWARSVIKSQCHKIEFVGMILGILNLEGHPNWMIGSKVTTFLTMFFVHDLLRIL